MGIDLKTLDCRTRTFIKKKAFCHVENCFLFDAIDVESPKILKKFNLRSIVELKTFDFTDKARHERDEGTQKSEKDCEDWQMETSEEQKARPRKE